MPSAYLLSRTWNSAQVTVFSRNKSEIDQRGADVL